MSNYSDTTIWTKERLDSERLAIINELERRYRFESIPQQVSALTIAFMSDGGKKDIIQDAVTSAALPDQLAQTVSDTTEITDKPWPDQINAPLA